MNELKTEENEISQINKFSGKTEEISIKTRLANISSNDVYKDKQVRRNMKPTK